MLKYFWGSLLLLVAACNSSESSFSFEKTGELRLAFETSIHNLSNISYYTEGGVGYITYLNAKNHCINFRNIKTDSIGYSVPMHQLDSIQNTEEGTACFVHNRDSIFILLNERNTIYLIDSKGKVSSSWNVNIPLNNNDREYVLQDIPPMRLCYRNHRIYVQAIRIDIVMDSPEHRKIYFNTPPEVVLDISTQPCSIINQTGNWPAIYKKGDGYQDFWPARCINSQNELVYSFGINDSLFIYNDDKLSRVIDAKSMFPQHISPYPDDSISHFVYLKKYSAAESRYKLLLFNPYRDEYYRMFSRGVEHTDENGKHIQVWSLMVLDQDFHKLSETDFDTGEYNDFSILPVPDGVLICKTSSPDDGRNILRFGLFHSVKNEK